MKFIHIADMHFDTPFSYLSSKGDFGKIRRMEQREVFRKIINYIKENNIDYLFIAGDLYEHNYIRKSTIEYINDLFKQISQTKIFITPGNHDPYISNSMYKNFKWNNNVKIFIFVIVFVLIISTIIYYILINRKTDIFKTKYGTFESSEIQYKAEYKTKEDGVKYILYLVLMIVMKK